MEIVVAVIIEDMGGKIMPRGDGTGPNGKGCRTGRGLGKSNGNNMGSGIGVPRGLAGGRNSGRRTFGQNSGQGRKR